jgi:hypothetical protein
MDGMYVNHKLAPVGWWPYAVTAMRWLRRMLGVNPGIRHPYAAALDPALNLPVGREGGPEPRKS